MLSSVIVSETPLGRPAAVVVVLEEERFGVIFTERNAVFICGDTEAIVPCRIVPFLSSRVTVSFWHFMRNLEREVGFVS